MSGVQVAEEAVDEVVVAGTTIAELCGVGAQQRAEMKVLDGGRVIHELL